MVDYSKKRGQEDLGAYNDRFHGCCQVETLSGRCHNAGSVSYETKGDTWYCIQHYRSTLSNDDVTRASQQADPHPDFSYEARAKRSQADVYEPGAEQ